MTEIVVEELFAESSLSEDPIFVAYLEDRDPLRVVENDVEITRSNIQFAFFEPGEIGVLTAESESTGDMSTLLDHVCRHFGATDVTFINVVTGDLDENLHGFEETTRSIGGERMRCLEGTWNVEVPA